MAELAFTKMHGLGNSFILLDDSGARLSSSTDVRDLAKSICDPNFGIGADGLILVNSSDIADFEMRIINDDGSEAEMCGNGIRCVARFVIDNKMTRSDTNPTPASPLRIDTLAGVIRTRLLSDDRVEVDMGEPVLNNADITADGPAPIIVNELGYAFTYVSMGNPHAVTFVKDFDFDWRDIGAQMERSPLFPNRTNVEFVRIDAPTHASMKVWERGCGETKACGTGACAVAVAGVLEDLLPRTPVTIDLPGGPLEIHWNDSGRVIMTGPATTICKGVYRLNYDDSKKIGMK